MDDTGGEGNRRLDKAGRNDSRREKQTRGKDGGREDEAGEDNRSKAPKEAALGLLGLTEG